MTDAGLPALSAPAVPQAPQLSILQQPAQLPVPPDQPILTHQIQHMPQLSWSHFKPGFSGRPEEDAEAHLLRTNACMDTHAFQEDVKVQTLLSHISKRSQVMV